MANRDRTTVTSDDEGKSVVDANGETIGIVTNVQGNHLHVDPDPGLTDQIASRLGWSDSEDTYTIAADRVENVTDDEIRLQQM